ncbi:hypothetical protein HYDPIDRAFT_27745 [Hydnomerulius pinastri MD-312]|uniref:DNA replication regulator SLD2 n=1 Tax=Hydnomerulius pinastri MD-312 TaxID=994086 RepID=A0A0C9WFP3_9AGAM|nr:hypothetical protein HYDPIDRAFT_27745 [Hydnomerulius pinastri MD-312]
MSDLATVRTEVKAWERDFRSRYGRDPSVQDIRDQPAIAEKYKLYKKLSKATSSSSQVVAGSSSQNPPSTPPRPPPGSSRAGIIPKSRAVEAAAPLPGFNPFSPVKTKGKEKVTPRASASQAPSRKPPSANPFATPAKNKSKPHARTRTPSPDPFPSILPPQPKASSSNSQGPHQSNTAVSRARKRLRGEPVSPSPNKPKRQRLGSQALLPLPNLEDSSNSEEEPDGELAACDFNSSFVDDSPVKAPAGGKSFKLLFDDALPALSIPKKSTLSAPSQPNGPSLDAYFVQGGSRDTLGQYASQKVNQHSSKSGGVVSKPGYRANGAHAKISNQIFPTKVDMTGADPVGRATRKPILTGVVSKTSQPRTSVKRALDEGDLAPVTTQLGVAPHAKLPLVPPSPPPGESTSSYRGPNKGKGKAVASRKKARVVDEESEEEEDSPDEIAVKVVTRNHGKPLLQNGDDLDWDPLLNLGARSHDPDAKGEVDANHHESDTFSVDLPDKLRLVLAISPSRIHNSKEERVVRGLLYGDRVGHYNASKGGDIWDVGEGDESVRGDTEAEDDWEGEPVPWEVGEL